jgi:SSS family solute:Na+ symporter
MPTPADAPALQAVDIAVFAAFFAVVLGVSLWKSRHTKGSEDYFLAGRGLPWWLIGISIVAANISTEQMVGMAGQGAGGVGLAVSNWQLVGSVGIVLIALTLLPRFLRAGIYTMPEFLEYRYSSATRSLMALFTVVIYVAVLLTAVLYSGGLTMKTVFGLELRTAVWGIGAVAAVYTAIGGLKAVAWADLFQGLALLLGGALVFVLGLSASGGWGAFASANADRLHMVLPASDGTLPWTGVASGMWIVILYYCGLNQFIVQRNLAARSLRDGQLGMIFAGGLWLLVPFVIVMPGIMAGRLYPEEMEREASGANVKTLEQFEQLRVSGNPGRVVFPYDDAWKAANAARAQELDAFNAEARRAAAAAGAGTADAQTLARYKYDAAFPILLKKRMPPGLLGFMFAAIAGAVISSLASMLNSASTVFTLDVYQRLLDRGASQARLVWLGRGLTLLFVVAACLIAPALDDPRFGGVFNYIQQFQGYIWPGVVAVFAFGILVREAPPAAGVAGLLAGPAFYALFQAFAGSLHFLVQVALAFSLVLLVMGLITFARPLKEPKALPDRPEMNVPTAPEVKWAGAAVIAAVVVFYIVFW